jgi:hypothetical protein
LTPRPKGSSLEAPAPVETNHGGLALAETRRAIARWHEADERKREVGRQHHAAEDALGDDPGSVAEERRWQHWSDVAWYAEHDAMTRVLQCLLLLNGAEGAERRDVNKRTYAPCGVRHEGRVYLAMPRDPDNDHPVGWEDPKGYDVMHLMTIEACHILDIDIDTTNGGDS